MRSDRDRAIKAPVRSSANPLGGNLITSLRNVTEPWTFVDIRDAYYFDFVETEEIIDTTEGGRIWNNLKSLGESVWLLESCTSDLLDIIAEFAHQTTKEEFWSKQNLPQQIIYERRVKKHIFCTTSAAMTLVDHARNFNTNHPCPEFDNERAERFGDSGIHEFVQRLRNYLSHCRIAETNWEISFDEVDASREVNFIFQSKDLLCWNNWSASAKKYIELSGDAINVYKLFCKYNEIACKLYEWHKAKILDTWKELLTEYFKYKSYLNKAKDQTSLNLLVTYVLKEKDPYVYLCKDLTNDQIEDVFSFEYKSTEQIDRIISILDSRGACDDGLRAKMHECLSRKA